MRYTVAMHRDDVLVRKPCFVADSALERREHGHYCGACRKHVYDLSAMSEDAALVLLELNGERGLCVSYLTTDTGQILHTATPTSQRHSRTTTLAGVAILAAGCGNQAMPAHVGGVPIADTHGVFERENVVEGRGEPPSMTAPPSNARAGEIGEAPGPTAQPTGFGTRPSNEAAGSTEHGKVYLVRGGYDRIPRKKPADPTKKKKTAASDRGVG